MTLFSLTVPSACDCESDFTDGTCEDLTGRCYCKPNFTGELCAACAEGYTNFPHCYREDQQGAWGGDWLGRESKGLGRVEDPGPWGGLWYWSQRACPADLVDKCDVSSLSSAFISLQ